MNLFSGWLVTATYPNDGAVFAWHYEPHQHDAMQKQLMALTNTPGVSPVTVVALGVDDDV